MKVQDVMTSDVTTCGPEDSTSHAAHLMWEHDCGIIPVIDTERHPIGVITDRDVCMAGYTSGRSLAEIRVGEVMSRIVEVCQAEDSLGVAETAMRRRHVRRLPIIDSAGRLVGLLSLSDLSRRAAEMGVQATDGLGRDEVAETLASICEPWCNINSRLVERPEIAKAQPSLAVSAPALAR